VEHTTLYVVEHTTLYVPQVNLWHILMPLPNEVGVWAVWMVCDGIGVTHDQV